MTDPTPSTDIPARAEREALNAALLTANIETGFWDDNGRPTTWPEDIDQWRPETSEPATHQPGGRPF